MNKYKQDTIDNPKADKQTNVKPAAIKTINGKPVAIGKRKPPKKPN